MLSTELAQTTFVCGVQVIPSFHLSLCMVRFSIQIFVFVKHSKKRHVTTSKKDGRRKTSQPCLDLLVGRSFSAELDP